jgi:branched-chain amino acid aminotransferase
MNLFIALKTPEGGVELVTAPLGDLVLPGVTRDRYTPSQRQFEGGELILQCVEPM